MKLKITILTLSVAALVSCANVTPIVHERETIPFNENEENAGIIQDFDDNSSEITESARTRYNMLILETVGILKYPFEKDFGVTNMDNGNYNITAEGKELWHKMKLDQKDVTK